MSGSSVERRGDAGSTTWARPHSSRSSLGWWLEIGSEELIRPAGTVNGSSRKTPKEMSRRSTQRAVWFAALAPPLQVAYAQAWEAHRRTHGIPRAAVWAASTAPSSVGPLLPDTRAERDENFLQQQLPGLTIDDPECMSSLLGS